MRQRDEGYQSDNSMIQRDEGYQADNSMKTEG